MPSTTDILIKLILAVLIGGAIGAGCLWIAAASCGLILMVLFVFSLVEGWIDRVNQIRNYKIVCPFQNETLHRYERLFTTHHLKFRRTRQSKSGDNMISGEWVVQGSEQNHRHVVHELMRDPSISSIDF